VEVVFWCALVAPARTPPEIIDKLHAALASLRDDPNLVKQLLPHGDIGLITPREFNERIRKETAIWGEIIRCENLQLD
jgi:tripartite-type tricarboxylate transporter receptor subunit TctC